MANTPKEKFKNHSRFCALVAFLSLSSAPLFASNKIEVDEKPSARSQTSYLDTVRRAALFIMDEKDDSQPLLAPQNDAVVARNEEQVEDTSRSLVLASSGFNLSFSNPITALTGYVKEVDWRKIALFILNEEDSNAKEIITVSGSGEEQLKVNVEEVGDKENEDQRQDRDHSFRQSDSSVQSDGANTPHESESDSEEEDKKPVHNPLAKPENQETSELGEEVQGELDSSLSVSDNHDSLNVSDDAPEEDRKVQQGSDVSSLVGEEVQGELDRSFNASENRDSDGASDGVPENEGSEVQQGSVLSSLLSEEVQGELDSSLSVSDNHDSVNVSDDAPEEDRKVQQGSDVSSLVGEEVQGELDGSSNASEKSVSGDAPEEDSEEDETFLNRRSKRIATVSLDSPTTQGATEEKRDKKSRRSPYQSPKKKAVTPPVTPKKSVTKSIAPTAPKTPEQAGFRDKKQTNIGPLYNGLMYTYQNPKGETKIVSGSRLSYFVGNSPHPKKFVLIEAKSPIKPRAIPFSLKFPKGIAEEVVEEDSNESSDSGSSSSSNDGSSDISDSDSDSGSNDESSDESNSDKVDTK